MTYGQLKSHLQEIIFDLECEEKNNLDIVEPDEEVLERLKEIMVAIMFKKEINNHKLHA